MNINTLTQPIPNIENRTPHEVYDIMVYRAMNVPQCSWTQEFDEQFVKDGRVVCSDPDRLKRWIEDLRERSEAAGGNYTADDDTFPTTLKFQSGRRVGIAFDGEKPYLTVGGSYYE